MQSSEVYRLLARRIRRGLIIFPTLLLVTIVSSGVATVVTGGRPWAFVGLLPGFLFYFGWKHVFNRNVTARRVSEYPQLVYWAHPTVPFQIVSGDAIHDCTLLLLHLRDGREFEVGLPTAQMRAFIAWLVERNPSVRLGPYDIIDSANNRPDL